MASRTDLVIDLASTNVHADPAEIARWAANESVFVSSLITDMPDEREAVRRAIVTIGARPVMFEHDLGAQDVSADRAYLSGLAGSTIYLGIFGKRYGQPLASGYSATHDEFRHAESGNLRMALYVLEPFTDADGPQRDFVGGVRARYTTAPYGNASDLEQRVTDRLRTLATEALTPWVVLGNAAFRASSIRVSGSRVTVRATIRDTRVAGTLKGYATSRADVAFAGPHDSGQARVENIDSESTSAGSQTMEISLAMSGREPQWHAMSINGRSADDVFVDALRGGFFGERVPQSYLGLATVEDPFMVLRGRNLPESTVRSLARVLADEELRRRGVTNGTYRFVLSPADPQGSRRLRMTWYPSHVHAQQPAPAERVIEGLVTGF